MHNNRVYLDNAATSYPKPPTVMEAMVEYARHCGASAGRGAYAEAQMSAAVLRGCREKLNQLFNGENPDHFIFTLNCTDALNLAIHGYLRRGDHAICTAMDHNSILRPLNDLTARGNIRVTRVPAAAATGIVDPNQIESAIQPDTRLICVGHCSNVTGTVQAIRRIGEIAKRHKIAFLVDAAQTAGHLPIDVQADGIDFLAAPGHKGLLGPLGTGFLYIRPGRENELDTLRQGGTGSVSEQDTQPTFMPDKFESGSHNALGIAGLSAGLDYILQRGIASLSEHQRALSGTFIEGIENVEGLRILGPQGVAHRVAVFSVQINGMAPMELAATLEKDFGILTRAGLHCAPGAHATMGSNVATYLIPDVGTTRLSFGAFNTLNEAQYAADALSAIALAAPVSR
ncbi:MAG: aminotransferase class V-fold PLP-dependent enzyme [Phycisphaerae bacterium]